MHHFIAPETETCSQQYNYKEALWRDDACNSIINLCRSYQCHNNMVTLEEGEVAMYITTSTTDNGEELLSSIITSTMY